MRADSIPKKAFVGALAALALAAALGLSACAGGAGNAAGSEGGMARGSSGGAPSASDGAGDATAANAYRKITAEEAKALIDAGGVTVVDVRTPQEYADGHVPGALNIPNEDIGSTPPSELSQDDKLVVYCRTGVRSKQASDKLVNSGFTDVNNMGGIVDWPYGTVGGSTPDGD